MTLEIEDAFAERLRARAGERGMTVAAYLQEVVARDLAEGVAAVPVAAVPVAAGRDEAEPAPSARHLAWLAQWNETLAEVRRASVGLPPFPAHRYETADFYEDDDAAETTAESGGK